MAQVPQLPEVLWHYTGPAGVAGIIEHGALWATDAEYLNDAQELRFGRDQIIDALRAEGDRRQSIAQSEAHWDPDMAAAITIAGALAILEDGDDTAMGWVSEVYLACFCAEGDLLSQWRGYARGQGYALAFQSAALARLPVESTDDSALDSVAELRPVAYGPDSIPARTAEILSHLNVGPVGHPGMRGMDLARRVILKLLAEHKHESFQEEREWRLIASLAGRPARTLFRSGSLGLIPYVNLEIPLGSALREVMVGPGPDRALRIRAVRHLLAKAGLYDVQVTASQAPFRP